MAHGLRALGRRDSLDYGGGARERELPALGRPPHLHGSAVRERVRRGAGRCREGRSRGPYRSLRHAGDDAVGRRGLVPSGPDRRRLPVLQRRQPMGLPSLVRQARRAHRVLDGLRPQRRGRAARDLDGGPERRPVSEPLLELLRRESRPHVLEVGTGHGDGVPGPPLRRRGPAAHGGGAARRRDRHPLLDAVRARGGNPGAPRFEGRGRGRRPGVPRQPGRMGEEPHRRRPLLRLRLVRAGREGRSRSGPAQGVHPAPVAGPFARGSARHRRLRSRRGSGDRGRSGGMARRALRVAGDGSPRRPLRDRRRAALEAQAGRARVRPRRGDARGRGLGARRAPLSPVSRRSRRTCAPAGADVLVRIGDAPAVFARRVGGDGRCT
jgi:hypothetical protein